MVAQQVLGGRLPSTRQATCSAIARLVLVGISVADDILGESGAQGSFHKPRQTGPKILPVSLTQEVKMSSATGRTTLRACRFPPPTEI